MWIDYNTENTIVEVFVKAHVEEFSKFTIVAYKSKICFVYCFFWSNKTNGNLALVALLANALTNSSSQALEWTHGGLNPAWGMVT